MKIESRPPTRIVVKGVTMMSTFVFFEKFDEKYRDQMIEKEMEKMRK